MSDDAQRKTERDAPDRREDLGGSGKPGGPADPLRQSRTSLAWLAASLLALLLVLLIILVVQNTQKVEVSFLGWNGQTPLAVALLVAAVAGLALGKPTLAGLRLAAERRAGPPGVPPASGSPAPAGKDA